jgi:hypothetical protein
MERNGGTRDPGRAGQVGPAAGDWPLLRAGGAVILLA